jgi:signal transduction histidine kinase
VENLGQWVQVTVQNHGLGVVGGRQPLERSARAYPGNAGGIGLATSRAIIELHGGRVWVETGGGAAEGSTFFVQLPRGRAGR